MKLTELGMAEKRGAYVLKKDEIYIQDDEFCIQNDGWILYHQACRE